MILWNVDLAGKLVFLWNLDLAGRVVVLLDLAERLVFVPVELGPSW